LQRSIPIFAGIFLFVVLSSIGLPGLNGFVGEFLVLLGTFVGYRWWVVPAAFGIVLAAIYLLWAYQRVFHGPVTSEENRTLPDLKWRELAMLAPVLVLITVIGVYPKPFLDRIEPSAAKVVDQLRNGTADPAKLACIRKLGIQVVAPACTRLLTADCPAVGVCEPPPNPMGIGPIIGAQGPNYMHSLSLRGP
jgi:formate hydrogenlyase subunit 3/multisubunit Na+/H+ antiporter MnhD subunit